MILRVAVALLDKFYNGQLDVRAWVTIGLHDATLAKDADWLASVTQLTKNDAIFLVDITDPALFNAYKEIRLKPENAWKIIGDLKAKGVTSELLTSYAKGKFFNEIMQQGKDFEKLIENLIGAKDAALIAKLETAFGLPAGKLVEYQHVTQLQINLGNGKYFVADNAWVKQTVVNNQTVFECYIGESKLSSLTDLSDNQALFKTQFNTGTTNFTVRNIQKGL
jgi:predicted RNase H-like HicB family nuclease